MFDTDTFEERAAIMEFCGGLSRFEAETQAAKAQGLTRWQALMEVRNANGKRNSEQGGNNRQAMGGGSRKDDLPRVQRKQDEENGPMPERDEKAGRDRLDMLALQLDRRGVL